jgi:membrane protease YdiL (CAAX protease family)
MLEGDQPQHLASDLLIYAAAEALTCLAGFCWLMVRHRTGLAGQGVCPITARDVKLGAIAAGTLLLPTFAIQMIVTRYYPTHHPIIELLKDQSGPEFFLASGVLAVIVAPIAEEFLFRVWLQSWLEKLVQFFRGREPKSSEVRVTGRSLILGDSWGEEQFGRVDPTRIPAEASDLAIPSESFDASLEANITIVEGQTESNENPYRSPRELEGEDALDADIPAAAMLVEQRSAMPILGSALLFALAHVGNGPDPIPLFLLAIGLGYVYQRTQRVVPCIMIHMACNAISLFAFWASLQSQ